jgi:hypothetical protein
LLKLGFTVAQSTVAKYMAKRVTVLAVRAGAHSFAIHMPHIAAIDLFVVPTIVFACSTPSSLFGWLGESWFGSM